MNGLSCIGEGNGNPLQCSCRENPRDGGAWWAAVYGVAQSQTRLKSLSSSSIHWCFEDLQTLEIQIHLGLIYIPSPYLGMNNFVTNWVLVSLTKVKLWRRPGQDERAGGRVASVSEIEDVCAVVEGDWRRTQAAVLEVGGHGAFFQFYLVIPTHLICL